MNHEGVETRRSPFLDIFRGIAILAVVEIHSATSMLSRFPRGSLAWISLFMIARCLLFAVPSFLMLTTLLQVRKLQQPFAWSDIWRKTLIGIAAPYFLWSGLHLLIAYKNHQLHATPAKLLYNLFFGEAFGSLYFLRLLFQLTLLLPLFAPLLRKRFSGVSIFLATTLLTLAFFGLNHFLWKNETIGRLIFWYLPAIGAGIWLGSRYSEIPEKIKTALVWLIPVAPISLGLYLPLAFQSSANLPVDTFRFQAWEWTYTICASIILLAVAWRLSKLDKISKTLEYVGSNSMQIYLIHPFLVNILARVLPVGKFVPFWFGVVLYPAIIVPICFGFALLFRRLKLSTLLFGR